MRFHDKGSENKKKDLLAHDQAGGARVPASTAHATDTRTSPHNRPVLDGDGQKTGVLDVQAAFRAAGGRCRSAHLGGCFVRVRAGDHVQRARNGVCAEAVLEALLAQRVGCGWAERTCNPCRWGAAAAARARVST